MRIENWAVVTTSDPHTAPCLKGEVFGHPRFDDGYSVRTSSIMGKTETGEVVTYSGSHYILGRIDALYLKRYPNARKRFLDSLPIINDLGEPQICPCCECNICECE